MGLFDWFTSTPDNVTVLDDMIWLTKPAKFQGIRQMVARLLAEQDRPHTILLVAHFRDCLDELQEIRESVTSSRPMIVSTADTLQSTRPSTISSDETHPWHIIVGERHPLLSCDDAILEFARRLPGHSRLVFHVSLQDPLMRAFRGEWVEGVLKSLGMADDEAIESKMVARRIKAAQQKLAGQCLTDYPADSAEKWLKRTDPESGPASRMALTL
ncbi:MAG: hypothetical protein JSS49_07365 [Planctomycetes bacterium]|nr:hypothetical protein [Planctomycetota bacterium]